jgi:6-phosphogluconate dehydrogenase (decarboxylating)
MPGGPASTWALMRPIFESIAAKVQGQPCVIHIGPGGAGHYVKMIHNGIEYGDMQLICEAYSLFRAAGMSADQMADVFDGWNDGELQSYLIQITGKALRQRDPETGQPVVDLILDKAGQKGTGQWTLMSAADNAVVVSTINAAVEARVLSSMKALRVAASSQLSGPDAVLKGDRKRLIAQVHDALYASKIVSYAQGLDLMRTMSDKKAWNLDLGAIAGIWRGGCIIRARLPRRPAAVAPDARTVLQRGAQPPPASLARRGGAGRGPRHSGAGVQRLTRVLRQPAHGASVRQPAAGAARFLRRAHLRAGGQAGRAVVSHRLAGGDRVGRAHPGLPKKRGTASTKSAQ